MTGILHDDEHGGWYPQVFADGSHAPGKVCYAHAFVILAASSALLAGRPGAKELLDEALATYDEHFWDDEIGLAVDTWDTAFTALDPYRGLNANMHTTEAFLAVADATGNNTYRVRAGRIIDHVIEWAAHNRWRIPDEHVIDHEGGSWFHQLDGDNRVIGTVWPGKSDLYHAFQSTLIPFLDPAVSIATAVKNAE